MFAIFSIAEDINDGGSVVGWKSPNIFFSTGPLPLAKRGPLFPTPPVLRFGLRLWDQ